MCLVSLAMYSVITFVYFEYPTSRILLNWLYHTVFFVSQKELKQKQEDLKQKKMA